MCKNKEVEEFAEVMGTLEKKLEERRQRLERMEGEPTQSDSRENEVVPKLDAPEKVKDSEEENRLIVALNAETDERMAEHVSFVSDDQFIKSKEFKSFMYHFKGKKLREAVPNVTPENESKMMKRLKKDIDTEVETMTPQKGNNGCGNNQNNGQNRGNNGNYGSGNGGCRNNANNNSNNNRGVNNGNNGNYGNNNGLVNNQSNHHVGRQPLIIESKTHYEIFSHRPNTLQQSFKMVVTIESNRKVAGKVARRDDPKLYNSKVPRKDDLTQIMDMLKNLQEQCMIAQGLIEEEDKNEDYEPTVFFNDEDILALRKLFQEEATPSLRNLTEEEKKAFTIAVVEQVKSNYQ
ncbi:uncharacterized protein LOC131857558 [Cryptomeria japonica]|uniref:uncharacterized protein LOC131857558 n=1 Tax=Cryptomeria japonica TaxID=3369 RepID=UPI0027D9CEDC|nr:uncharacterized protein LOC131857558 [Cryptomeria japonica]